MTQHSPESTRADTASPGHEPDGLSLPWLTTLGTGLLALLFVVISGVALAFTFLVPSRPLTSADREFKQQLTTPGVQPNQAYDRERIEAAERVTLNHYGWQAKQEKIARIPIERAIELMAEHKLQVKWPKAASAESPNSLANTPPEATTISGGEEPQ